MEEIRVDMRKLTPNEIKLYEKQAQLIFKLVPALCIKHPQASVQTFGDNKTTP